IIVVIAMVVVEPECQIPEQRDTLADGPTEVITLVPQGIAEIGPRREQFPSLREIRQHADRPAPADSMALVIGVAIVRLGLGEGKKDLVPKPATFHCRSDSAVHHSVAA